MGIHHLLTYNISIQYVLVIHVHVTYRVCTSEVKTDEETKNHPLPLLRRNSNIKRCILCIWNAFGKNQQYWFASDNGKEYAFSLEKNIKLLEGHRYRLYFRKPQQGTGQSMPCAGDILGYEELTDQLPELPDTSV